jgi:reactive chlorine resistance protein C
MTTNVSTVLRTAAIETVASVLGRYGLVIVIGWIGALKFANYEAHQIQPLVANSPWMGWVYQVFPVYTFSALLGVFEQLRASRGSCIAARPRRASARSPCGTNRIEVTIS